jgi:hypothetical protein
MVFRAPRAAPMSRVSPERRGAVVGRYCHGCNQVFRLHLAMHSGDPIYGRDHVASTCPYEGWTFEPDGSWWEAAVEVLPAPPAAVVGTPATAATVTPVAAAPAAAPAAAAASQPKA